MVVAWAAELRIAVGFSAPKLAEAQQARAARGTFGTLKAKHYDTI